MNESQRDELVMEVLQQEMIFIIFIIVSTQSLFVSDMEKCHKVLCQHVADINNFIVQNLTDNSK